MDGCESSDTMRLGLPMHSKVGVVVIGRNEGKRLITCLQSVPNSVPVVYIDSNSTDGSVKAALDRGIEVVELDLNIPFTAARARNVGLKHLMQIEPGLRFVQFVDADCELISGWIEKAVALLESQPEIAAVCGRLRERHPEKSIYNWLCSVEWDGPIGEIDACGGIALFSVSAFQGVHGFRDSMIAGEESEICLRLRRAKLKIWRLDLEMALHDAAITRFGEWWRRSKRSGYAFALGADLHGAAPEYHWVWESRRAVIWGLLIPGGCFLAVTLFGWRGAVAWLVYPVQIFRLATRGRGSMNERTMLAFFQVLSRFPEALGYLKFRWNRVLNRQGRLIEYK